MNDLTDVGDNSIIALGFALESLRDMIAERDALVAELLWKDRDQARTIDALEAAVSDLRTMTQEKHLEIQRLADEIALLRDVAAERAQLLLANDREYSALLAQLEGRPPCRCADGNQGADLP